MSAHTIVQMLGIVLAKALLLVADPCGFVLFIIPSTLVLIFCANPAVDQLDTSL